ncbi:hypothetical protein Vretimale_18484 [Volvox reticuliferus]|uniref:Uncharacterized protein n=1 Tax=Volvox reticuliferus TaxID=1737510 RepID=A0A8J4CZQ5_9CHLO|nr:hypothetical protein Vretifemale_19773 [Volvox reticuliferus]GIM15785.1 hypothetical protein Vretimale_18484 [Volvox reticuliferus]
MQGGSSNPLARTFRLPAAGPQQGRLKARKQEHRQRAVRADERPRVFGQGPLRIGVISSFEFEVLEVLEPRAASSRKRRLEAADDEQAGAQQQGKKQRLPNSQRSWFPVLPPRKISLGQR